SYYSATWIWDVETQRVRGGPYSVLPQRIDLTWPETEEVKRSKVVDVSTTRAGGRELIAAVVNGRVHIYDVVTGESLPGPNTLHSIVVSVAFGQLDERSIIITGSLGGILAVWDTVTAQRLTSVTLDASIQRVWFVHGDSAVAAAVDSELQIYDLVRPVASR